MQSILSQVTRGITQAGIRAVIAGGEKIGKTSMVCGAPSVLLVPLELGYASMAVTKTPMLTTWEEVEKLCEELLWQAQAGQIARGSTISWDSATALERVIDNYTIRCDPDYKNKGGKLTMETAHGGYGKAYGFSNQMFERWTRYMDALAFHYGINVLVTCHVFAARAVDPAHGEFDTWDLLLHSPKNQKTYGKREFMTQWADLIGFLHEPMFVMKAADGEQLNRAVSANQGRMLALNRTPAWVAGNRYGMTGVISVPQPPQNGLPINSWNALAWALYNSCGIDVFNRS